MRPLTSISKPAAAATEMAPAPAEPRLSPGQGGTASGATSRAERAFVRAGRIERAPGFVPVETVIGFDDRVRILETDLAPWRMICALDLVGPAGRAIGTGWLAGPRTIVTAGHCVHHLPFFGGWADSIIVRAGRDGDEAPFGALTATRFSALETWVDSADPDFDVGCIHLDADLGDETGTLSFAALPPETLHDYRVNISGYPSDRGMGAEQYFHANAVLSTGPHRIFYDVDTFGGQSGSPVWIIDEPGGAPQVVGIHAYGTGGTPFDLGITANSAPRITPALFEVIEGWIAADAKR